LYVRKEREISYDPWAEVYDVVYADMSDDVPLYLKYARKQGSPVLEMACGTGRVLLPLAEKGYEAWGIDASKEMLAVARGKLRRLPAEVRARVHLSVADMRDFRLKRKFRLILCAFRSFLHLLTPADQRKALENARDHLADRGIIVIDIFAPFHHLLAQGERTISQVFEIEDGRRFVKHDFVRNDLLAQHIRVDSMIEEYDRDGVMIRKTVKPIELTWIHRREMEHLLELSGFRLVEVLGSFDGKPYDYRSGEAIYVAEKT
jgi:SAM-dependent methyltransferase